MGSTEVIDINALPLAAGRTDVAVVGEINPDMIVYGLPRELMEDREMLASGFTVTLGSSSAILAHNLALLGSRVSLSSLIGCDVLGEMCCQMLRKAGVELEHVIRSTSGTSTGVTLILPLETTRRILTFPGAMFELGIDDLDFDYLASAKHFHLSSLFLHRKLSPDIPGLFKEMKRRGLTTSLDTNDDPENTWDSGLEQILPLVDALFCNEEELMKLAKTERAADHVSAKVPLLVVKRGARGASAYAAGRRIDVPSLQVDAMDSVGAGDTFDAGFLHQWVRHSPLETCVAYGNLAASLSVTRSGGTEAFMDSAYRQSFFGKHWRNGTLAL